MLGAGMAAVERECWNLREVHEAAKLFMVDAFADLGLSADAGESGHLKVRTGSGRRYDVRIKGARTLHYMYVPKRRLQPREDLLLGVVLFLERSDAEAFLIPTVHLVDPETLADELLKDRDFDGGKSEPEYGLSLSPRTLPLLRRFFGFDAVAREVL